MSISKAIEQDPSGIRPCSQNGTDHACWHAEFSIEWYVHFSEQQRDAQI